MVSTKTKHQRKTEQTHRKIVKLYRQLSDGGMFESKTALWEEISRRTGYTREGIQRVLRVNGINYSSKNK